jgi:hypothetical protein
MGTIRVINTHTLHWIANVFALTVPVSVGTKKEHVRADGFQPLVAVDFCSRRMTLLWARRF